MPAGNATSLAALPAITNVNTTLRGAFQDPDAASGTWDQFSGSWQVLCGSTFAFGSARTVLAAGTWSARKR